MKSIDILVLTLIYFVLKKCANLFYFSIDKQEKEEYYTLQARLSVVFKSFCVKKN
jgi:hypothetical protein